jgi:hypothetical protein
MRVLAFAAIAGLCLAAASGAEARTWTDPAGRVVFDAPDSWSVMDQHQTNLTYVIVGTANDECHVLAIPRTESQTMTPAAIRRGSLNDANYSDEAWLRVSGGLASVFPAAPQVLSRTKETDHFWPIQRAELQGERLVHGAIQLRPGVELQAYCQTYEGADATAAYDAVIRSVRTANDAALQAQAEQEAPAAPATPPPAH